ncbi:type II toxin-antitoxin system RelE/ParE family toxin [Achromobacter sp. MFA1 R4]|uniref:type II toxin-antitoxin system RelE/ParE family toxin n=1 Tax=Achromobacter sp. MFA1 R4 TaxID=1881016 RepID=UPI000953713F|nr:type II toxin-antitoxin system RelE/ParE family toxin [Achromobacter sp. MFA1 R4]SIT14562.1 putative addiction module killer protein [Achromobacter sp. MFA1 R4]
MYEIKHYLAPDGRTNPYLDWLNGLRDNRTKVAVIRRIARAELGIFGDHRFCRDGIWELRIDVGPGYRVYYTLAERRVVLLLCGGDKNTQATDIASAVRYQTDWAQRP